MKRLRKSIGLKIRERRIAMGYPNQIDLAVHLGVDQSRISKWETGTALPEGQNRAALEEALTLPPDFFDMPSETSQERVDPDELGRAVTALVRAGPATRNTVLFLLLGDEAYLEKLPARLRQRLEALGVAT